MDEIKFHVISGKEFYVPAEISYRQYFAINELLKSVKIDPLSLGKLKETEEKTEIKLNGTIVYSALMAEGKLPEFFATLLVPKDAEKWQPEFLSQNKDLMFDIGDKTMLEVLESFLSGRADLIDTILNFLLPLIAKKTQLLESSRANKKGSST